jgi:hypothetical protein
MQTLQCRLCISEGTNKVRELVLPDLFPLTFNIVPFTLSLVTPYLTLGTPYWTLVTPYLTPEP